MLDVWNQETGGSAGGGQAARQLLDARQGLRRPLTEADVQAAPAAAAAYTRTANEIYRQFHRLPNPDLVMYVFPHLAGTDPVPVPGYTTCSRSTSACSTRCRASAWRTTDGLVAALGTQGRHACRPRPGCR
jgi:conjugative transfer region lipoprotein (TIGR03751 family)